MTLSLRSNRGIAVSAVAPCAVIGATTPVWATSGSSHGHDPQTQRALADRGGRDGAGHSGGAWR